MMIKDNNEVEERKCSFSFFIGLIIVLVKIMYNIAIVEDSDIDASRLEEFLSQADPEGKSFKVSRFTSGLDFIKNYQPIYAVILFDIELPGMNGLETAMEIRKIDKSCSIIFVTNLIQYAQKGYEVDAIAYLIKPIQYYDFILKFKKAIDLYALNENKDFTVKTASGPCRISTDKLMYVEVAKHRLYYHLVDDVLEVTGSLSKTEEDLKPYGFLKCNQCYLINPRFIIKIKGMDVQIGNETLAISRPRKKAFLSELAKWYGGF